jgi:hypothetical protein
LSNSIEYSCTTGSISKLESFGITTMFEDNRSDGTQYCDQFLHNLNFEEFFNKNCIGQASCSISEIEKFLDTSVDKNMV